MGAHCHGFNTIIGAVCCRWRWHARAGLRATGRVVQQDHRRTPRTVGYRAFYHAPPPHTHTHTHIPHTHTINVTSTTHTHARVCIHILRYHCAYVCLLLCVPQVPAPVFVHIHCGSTSPSYWNPAPQVTCMHAVTFLRSMCALRAAPLPLPPFSLIVALTCAHPPPAVFRYTVALGVTFSCTLRYSDAIKKDTKCFGEHDDDIAPTMSNTGLFKGAACWASRCAL